MALAPWLVLAVCSGCFSKPEPPHDATASICESGVWDMTPTPIDVSLNQGEGANSPWLDNSRTDLYFTIVNSGPPTIVHSTYTGSWSGPTSVQLAITANDNPFLADNGSLWFDSTSGGTTARMIYEAPPAASGGFKSPVLHPELLSANGDAKEPAIARDGKTIYFADNGSTQICVYPGQGTAVALAHAGSAQLESPSIAPDDTTLYYSDYTNGPGGELISQAPVDNGSLGQGLNVAPFQSGGIYFDANISRDGKTLVFAAKLGTAQHASLYYVTRTCD